ncbi:MAG: hypothetical protein AAB584_01680 [Patescibacteria group bacterium]
MKLGELRVKKESFTLKVLKAVAIGGMALIATSNKRFWLDFYLNFNKELNRYKTQKERSKLYHALRYLRGRKFVDVAERPDGLLVKISTKGYEVVKFFESIEKMNLIKPTKWDGKFRLVIFDIPAKKQGARIVFIQKLKEMNFYMLQKSIWVHPYDCTNEIAVLKKLFEIEPYVKIVVADAIEEPYKILKNFNLFKRML